MECQEFIVLYTHQKMKKSKVWQDGVLKITHVGNKAILYDDKGTCLESLFLKCLEVKPGDDLESERYLITVEEAKAAGSRAVELDGSREALESGPRTTVASSRSLGCQPSGLKRKTTGFQRPYKMPKKVTVTENSELATSLGDANPGPPGPRLLPVFSSTLPLFSTVGQKDITPTSVDNESFVTFRNTDRSDMPLSLLSSSFKINTDTLDKEDKLCFPVISESKHSNSFLASEPTRRNGLDSHCPGVSQNVRSKAQILALLKSSSINGKDLHGEITGRFPKMEPQGCLKITSKPKEDYAETWSTGNLRCEQQSENPTRTTSRWARYLPSQRSPPCSARDENDPEDKPEAREDMNIFNLSELLVQKNSEDFETCTEKGEFYSVDRPVDNNCQYWSQEENLAPSFCKDSSILVSYSSKEKVSLLSESDIQYSSKVPFSQNELLCTREDIQGADADATLELECRPVSPLPEIEHKQLEIESSLSTNSRISDDIIDMVSKSSADRENLNTVDNTTQPFLEVSFNLSNFETSDTDEESQEDSRLPHDSESWEKEVVLTDDLCVQKGCGDIGCRETAGEHLPLLSSADGKPKEAVPANETLLSEFCDRTCVGFNSGPHEDANTGKALEDQGHSDIGSSLDSSLEWNEDVPEDSKEDISKSIQGNAINYGIIAPSNKHRGVNTSLHIPYLLNTVTNLAPENSDLFSKGTQPFILKSHIDKNDEQDLLPISRSDISVQLLSTTQDHSECHELEESSTQVSSPLFYPAGIKHTIYRDSEAYISESKEVERIRSLPCDHLEVEITQRNQQSWATSKNSSELSEAINNMALLKSQSEHSKALGNLALLKKKHAFPQEVWQSRDPDVSPKARTSPATVVSHALLEYPREHRAPQQPVEFQGHQVKGSATSAVMVRGHSLQLGCSQFPDSVEYENFLNDTCVWTPELPSTHVQTDFLQVISPKQKISALSPAPTFSFITRNEDSVFEFSEESLKTRTFPGLKNIGFQDSKNIQRFPFVSGASAPFVTLPPDDVPAVLDSCSFMTDDDSREPSGSSMLNLCGKSGLSCDLELEDQSGTPGDVSLLPKSSTQSKWLKYQNPFQCNSTAPNRLASEVTEGLCAETVSSLHLSHPSEQESCVDPVHLQMIKGMLCQQQQDCSRQDLVSRKKVLSLNFNQTSKTEALQTVLGSSASDNCRVKELQEINNSDLCFPNGEKIVSAYLPQRQVHIPAVFQSPAHYRQIFTSSIIEHLNILLFELAQRLYKALSKVDISFYTSSKGEMMKSGKNNSPSCHHNQPAKLVMVKKEGPNKGRLFYICDKPKGNQCKFFKWLEEVTSGQLPQIESQPNMIFNDVKSIGSYLRSQKVPVYEECQLSLRKGFDFQRKQYGKLKKLATVNPEFYSETKSKIYLKLSRKESSSIYNKGDLWVISKTLDFELDTFIACSAFFGPSSVNEVELLPLKGYFPSNWPTNITVHALLVCNASTELTTLQNIQDYFNPATLPLMPYLLTMSQSSTVSSKTVSKRRFIPPAITSIKTKCELLHLGATLQLARELINIHRLNKDQATALIQIAQMMASQGSDEDALEPISPSLPITVIHGVFGAGKSYLLAVVILFLVELFEKCDSGTVDNSRPWKLLISSSTNVAVDRVLLGLLSLGFEKFIRVGSVRKIAKPVLPYSLHAGSDNESEQLKELHALMKEELTPTERVYVRKSIEQHKLGTNRVLLKQVRVVGITCAACPFPCMNDLKFPVVMLDECSQMTEPASLLPIARFECEKLILVGDPKQLPPTIQGSDAAHENGLEQTLFDRLCLMGHKPILLRTQYRCHPVISAIANDLFYEGNLVNGISERERSPVLEWLPTLCFYNVTGAEQVERENSFVNVAEATFTLKLIQSLIASGVEGCMIGVITLYKSQMYKICSLLSAVDVDHPDVKAVQVSTVDAFQGAEKEVIILSCVRTRQVGFIDSEKRTNVALTRGRRHLLIVGSLSCLRKNRLWGRVIRHCEGREDGLQHASQCEPQLDHLLKDYLEKQAEERQKKKEKEKSKDKSH
ncbi:protein ZGRF1 isoform X1 [Grammomys surdaster]|uniref:protein ZGRF1 isoform X1 n=1 Tax=Grammomys surdaster TaxID=491861 RepID=UPI00109F18F0|nr:protein ZGRF1 isoform X1 [Grammomys surdaster]